MFKIALIIMLGVTLGLSVSGAAPNPKKVYNTAHVNPHAPVIDGKLDDAAWDKVQWETDFIQRQPYEGQPPSQQTSFKILYDDNNLYVAIRSHDTEPAKIVRRMTRRDGLDGDWVFLQLDSYHDLRTAFVFGVNAEGVKYDKILSEDGNNENLSWDPNWYVKTSVDEKGWIAEMKIPFSQVRFSNNETQVWGMEVVRFLFRKQERSLWQFIPQNCPGYVNLFGELHGIKNIKHKRQMEITPYSVGKLEGFPKEEGNPFATGRAKSAALGLDGKIGINSDLTMDFTINPDFGQVEADPSEVNLTSFETYYQEKRPFFIEGKNILNFQVMGGDGDFSSDNLFYSRRIVRPPHYQPNTGDNEYMDIPAETSILGAFKLTGKTRNGLSIGILESLTAKEKAEIDFIGQRRFETVEPLTNYFLARVQKDYNQGKVIIGGMFAATNRGLKNAGLNLGFLHKSAYTGGMDFYYSWKNKVYSVSLNTVFSLVQGSKEAILNTQMSSVHYFQRPDATHARLNPNRTSLSGFGGTFAFEKGGSGHFNYSTGVTLRSPGLELNDLGYLRTADRIMQWVWAGYRVSKPFSIFRYLNLNFNQWMGWNFDGQRFSNGGNFGLNTQFKNYWSIYFGINPQGKRTSLEVLRGGPSMKIEGGFSYWAGIDTDSRKPCVLEIGTSHDLRNNHSMRYHEIYASLSYRPISNLSFSIIPSYSTNKNVLQYVNEIDYSADKRYILGSLDQKTASITMRVDYSITPDISIQFYGQPFISSGKYFDFKYITDPKADQFENRFQVFNSNQVYYDANQGTYSIDENLDNHTDYSFNDPNFNFLQFRSNLVIRWEYIPGSTVFLVWSQGRTGIGSSGDFSFSNDFRDLFNVKPHNVFLIKFTYLFNL
jgi:hypothetical protein